MTESDPAGTNYVLEEWCIAEQPALWAAFANYEQRLSSNQTVDQPHQPESQWPPLSNGLDADSTRCRGGDVSTNAGAIGGVQLQYATDAGFGTGNPSKGVASEKNASGDYAQPSPRWTSPRRWPTPPSCPTAPISSTSTASGPNVYNPSTYSYLLSPATGWQAAKGAVMSAFVNYALTLGQQKSPSFGYASLGLSLERWGVDEVSQTSPVRWRRRQPSRRPTPAVT